MYGALIYTFPRRIYRLSEEEGTDFFLYVFERERIYKRLQTFEGRNMIQFETYLSYYVLRTLFLDWRRSTERAEFVSLDAPAKELMRGVTIQDILPSKELNPD